MTSRDRTTRAKENTILAPLREHLQDTLAEDRKNGLSGLGEDSFRQYYWQSSFLGSTQLVEMAALGAALVKAAQGTKERWSHKILLLLKELLLEMELGEQDLYGKGPRLFFQNSGPESLKSAKREKAWQDLQERFRSWGIEKERVSFYQPLEFRQAKKSYQVVKIPKEALRQHKKERWLTLVSLDIHGQTRGKKELGMILEAASVWREILCHGALTFPSKNAGRRKYYRIPYYLLLDTEEKAVSWLENTGLKGRIWKIISYPQGPSVPKRTSQGAAPSASPALAPRPFSVRRPRREGPQRPRLFWGVMNLMLAGLLAGGLFFMWRADSGIYLASKVAERAEKQILLLINHNKKIFPWRMQEGTTSQVFMADLFENNKDLIYLGIPRSGREFRNTAWLRNMGGRESLIERILEDHKEELAQARRGKRVLFNVSPYLPQWEKPILGIAEPYFWKNAPEVLVMFVDVSDTLIPPPFALFFREIAIINSQGEILAHSQEEKVLKGERLQDHALTSALYTLPLEKGQIRHRRKSGNHPAFLSFTQIPSGNLRAIVSWDRKLPQREKQKEP